MRRRRLPLSLLRPFFAVRAKSAQRAQSCQQPVAVNCSSTRQCLFERTRAGAVLAAVPDFLLLASVFTLR